LYQEMTTSLASEDQAESGEEHVKAWAAKSKPRTTNEADLRERSSVSSFAGAKFTHEDDEKQAR
jgi:hypothetical protein